MTLNINQPVSMQSPVSHPLSFAPKRRQAFGDLDAVKRDRFELLSAYLDGEVTPDERRQINRWLADDPGAQCLYNRLLKLRQGIQTLPVPTAEVSVEQTLSCVLQRVGQRIRLLALAGAGTAAVLVLGGISGVLEGRPGLFKLAQLASPAAEDAVLEVALDEPIIEIPKSAVAPATFSE